MSTPKIGNKSEKYKQIIQNQSEKEQNGNVKTYVRFRPNNQAEIDLNNSGLGTNVIEFVNQ